MTEEKFGSGKDWTFEDIERVYTHIERIAREKYNIDYYPNQIEIISSEQMLDAYASVGMPLYYSHWSFGKQFVTEQEAYKHGKMGLAYEIVINSSPCISYLMEENTMTMQALVIAHAAFGHNNFFKNNINFQEWTDAEAIIDYLAFAKHYIGECEEKYGEDTVSEVLDSAHALRLHGIDRYKRPAALSREKQRQREKDRQQYEHERFDDIWRTIPKAKAKDDDEYFQFPKEPEENLLYFIEKNAPNLEQWKKEILRIIRKIAQYFYPQMLTKIMNEGWATFWHYTIMYDLYEEGLVTDGFMFEFLRDHTNVVTQRPFQSINPYALGFAMFQDIKRICMEPTDEDRKWFPEWAGNGDWLNTLKFAAYNFKDESFILQYLSPKVMRDMGLFYILDDDDNPHMRIDAISNDDGYRLIREKLAEQQNVNNPIPYIQVTNVDVWGDRSIELSHTVTKHRMLEYDDAIKTLSHVVRLWGYEAILYSVDGGGDRIEEFSVHPDELEIEEDYDEQ